MSSLATVGKVKPIRWTSKWAYTWNIDEACFQNENESVLWSPIFEVNHDDKKTKWQMKIQPMKSHLANLKDFISVYLYSRNDFDITVQMEFCFLNNKNKCVECRSLAGYLYKSGEGLGYYVRHPWSMDKDNSILCNGQLRIRCEIVQKNMDNAVDDEQFSSSRLSEDFGELLKKNKFSDVTLKTKEENSFHLHKCILASRSSVFQAIFKSKMKETCQDAIGIMDFSYEVMNQLFRYIYTGKACLMGNLAIDLLPAAKKYNIKGLIDLCEKSLCDRITFSNVLEFLKVADMHNALLLRDKAIEYISSHVDEIADMPGLEAFITLHPALTCQIFAAIKSECY